MSFFTKSKEQIEKTKSISEMCIILTRNKTNYRKISIVFQIIYLFNIFNFLTVARTCDI